MRNDPMIKIVDKYIKEQNENLSIEAKIDFKAETLNLPLLEDKGLLLEGN